MTLIVITHENEIARRRAAPHPHPRRKNRTHGARIMSALALALAACRRCHRPRMLTLCLPSRASACRRRTIRATGQLVRVDANGSRAELRHHDQSALVSRRAARAARDRFAAKSRLRTRGRTSCWRCAPTAKTDPDCPSRRQVPPRCPSTNGATARSAPASATRISSRRSTSGPARPRSKSQVRRARLRCHLKSTPGPADRTHYSEVRTWLDKASAFPYTWRRR